MVESRSDPAAHDKSFPFGNSLSSSKLDLSVPYSYSDRLCFVGFGLGFEIPCGRTDSMPRSIAVDVRKEGGSLSTHLPKNKDSQASLVVCEVDTAYSLADAAA